MTIHCVSCNKVFRNYEAFNEHVGCSKTDALRRLANQLDRDQKSASQASKSNRKPPSTQSRPDGQKMFVSQTYPLGTQKHCKPCNKFFRDTSALNQHLRDSKMHNAAVLPPLQVQLTPQKTAILGPHQRNPSLGNAVASSSHPPPIMNHGGDNVSEKQSPWSVISRSENIALLEKLSSHCHSPEDLLKNKYVLSPYSNADIDGLRKCKRCGRLAKNSRDSRCYFHPGKLNSTVRDSQRHFTCCQTANGGCTSTTHDYRKTQHADKYRTLASSPAASPQQPKFLAIALDCEMAGVRGARGLGNEVILVCAVDYFTGAVLLNKLVHPSEKVRDWRTKIHGITNAAMKEAVSLGHALAGWKEARAELWKLIDQNTILVGHALQHDLDVLRMVHTRVVDSAILARNAVGMSNSQWGLQRLCQELLSVEIRKNNGAVHDCLEDVLATREVVLWCTQNKPKLEAWAEAKRVKLLQEEEQRKAARQKQASKKAEAEKLMIELGSGSSGLGSDYDLDESDEEVLHWSDIAEDLGWPHPDTGYDPWSD